MKEKEIKRASVYDESFKRRLVMLHESGRSIKSLSESFGVSKYRLYSWRKLYGIDRAQRKTSTSTSSVDLNLPNGFSTELLEEVRSLREENMSLKEERDILKKAMSILSRYG